MFSQSIVQWNYIIYFHIRGSFFNNFLHHFWKRVNNSKGIVNLQGLLMLIVVYVDMTTYPLTKHYYIIERVYFIYQLFILFISIFSYLYLYFHIYTTFVLTIQKRSRYKPAPPPPHPPSRSTICRYAS